MTDRCDECKQIFEPWQRIMPGNLHGVCFDRRFERSVECPLCQAEPDTMCINTSGGGRFLGFIHRERRHAAQEASRGL